MENINVAEGLRKSTKEEIVCGKCCWDKIKQRTLFYQRSSVCLLMSENIPDIIKYTEQYYILQGDSSKSLFIIISNLLF